MNGKRRNRLPVSWQGHEKGIRIGMVLVTVGSLAGGILPFFFLSELKFGTAVLIMSGAAPSYGIVLSDFCPGYFHAGKEKGRRPGMIGSICRRES